MVADPREQEATNGTEDAVPARGGGAPNRLLVIATSVVVALALGAVFWPQSGPPARASRLLVLDTGVQAERQEQLYQPLTAWLSEVTGRRLTLLLAADRQTFAAGVASGADYVLCPDALALTLSPEHWRPLAAARRSAPMNLRPRGVLLRRKTAPGTVTPWRDHPARTAFGDSLSLTGAGAVATLPATRDTDGAGLMPAALRACSWGPDPYDHAPVLHAARLGGFDYIIVRQWDAERFFRNGMLSPAEWDQSDLTAPVPDIVMMAAAELSTTERMAVREALSALGRSEEQDSSPVEQVRQGLATLHLAGFNILLEPDLDLARRQFKGGWLTGDD